MRRLEGCVIVGGASVASFEGAWYIQSRFLAYLDEMAEQFGRVTFFASVAPSHRAGRDSPHRIGPRIEVEPVQLGSGPPFLS